MLCWCGLDGGSCAAAYDYYRRDVCVADSFLLHTLHTLRDAPQRVNQTRDANAKPHCSCTHAHTQTPYTHNIQPCTRHTHTLILIRICRALAELSNLELFKEALATTCKQIQKHSTCDNTGLDHSCPNETILISGDLIQFDKYLLSLIKHTNLVCGSDDAIAGFGTLWNLN